MDWFGTPWPASPADPAEVRRPIVPDVPDAVEPLTLAAGKPGRITERARIPSPPGRTVICGSPGAVDSDEPDDRRGGIPPGHGPSALFTADFDGDCMNLMRFDAAGHPCGPASRPHEFKVIVAGASGAGKTAYVRRHRTGAFKARHHEPTLGVEVHPLRFHTTAGPVTLKVWDLAGEPQWAGLGEGYYAEAQGLLAFYDLTRLETLAAARAVLEGHAGLPAVLVGAKVDLTDGNVVRVHPLGAGPAADLPFWEVSARTGYNFEKPVLSLMRFLVGDPALQFVDAAPVVPAPLFADPY
jgi:GTP-binding nuclear protein Ran